MSLSSTIDSETWRALKKVNGLLGGMLLFGDWAIIIFTISVIKLSGLFWLYPIGVIIIGARMVGLFALLHDGHHGLIFKNEGINDRLTEWMLAWPLFRSTTEYGQQHDDHHKHLGGDGDPNFALLKYREFQFPMTRDQIAWILLSDLTGFNFLKYRVMALVSNPFQVLQGIAQMEVPRLIYYSILVFVLTYFGFWTEFLLFWIVPFITYFQLMVRITLIADHCFASAHAPLVRTVRLNWFERVFMVPHQVNYHFEHHRFGGVPCYNLKKLHQLLVVNPTYFEQAELCQGYGEVLARVTTKHES